MSENLVIVESPAKAKTIGKFLGKGFEIKSSYGHIRDLEKKNLGIDVENNFTPKYIISQDKKKIVSELRKAVKSAKVIWLASDEDREGEAIAWHLAEVLKLNKENTKRIVFHEITKSAIVNAIEKPRTINIDLVNAQQARRILDRLVGFEISPVLWRKVKPSLSAGRVQSVSVRLIVDREREILAFQPETYYKVTADFFLEKEKKHVLKAELDNKFKSKKEVLQFLDKCIDSDFAIGDIIKKPSKKSPPAPFTTSTLQQEASRKLGFSVSRTMQVAQRLYENGHITYMRTDSVNLSDEAINSAKNEIINRLGPEYSYPRQYKTKSKSAQEAHEAIRPTYMQNESISENHEANRLYELIWKRTLASQMKDAEFEKTTIRIDISKDDAQFIAMGQILKFDGFLKVYMESFDDDKKQDSNESTLLPPVNKGDELNYKHIDAIQKFTHHPARYTEASLVRKLEELGIGRPSTYAPIISTIQNRGYVLKESRDGTPREFNHITLSDKNIAEKLKTEISGAEKSKLFPTDIGMVVNDFLMKYFTRIMDYNFTANVEKEFDSIALGEKQWTQMIDQFYGRFHKNVEETLENSERGTGERLLGNDPDSGKPVFAKISRYGAVVQLGETGNKDEKPKFASLKKDQLIETITLDDALNLLEHSNQGRLVGPHPESGKNIYVRIGKYGPLAQIGENEDENKQYASLRKGQSMESITLDEALELFKLPRDVGMFEEKKVIAAIGRFGPYVRHDGKFYSLKKTDDPLSITIGRAIELIEAKRESDKKRLIKEFKDKPEIKVIKDRWGKPCIYYKKKYHRLSSKVDPQQLTYEDCLNLVEADSGKKTSTKKKSK